MEKIDFEKIVEKNPHLDRDSLEALRKYLQTISTGRRTRYRLAPIGTRRATVAAPNPKHGEPRLSTPGF